MITVQDIAKMIDHSLLKPELTEQEVREGCRIARQYDVASVCVKPCDVTIAREELRGSSVLVTTVIGFPHGANTTGMKVLEAEEAIRDGAVELDMVLNIGRLLSGQLEVVEEDIRAVVYAAHQHQAAVKVILENCYLTDELKETASRLCERAGADFIKTSTGYGSGGATIADLELMRRATGPGIQIKAAGGVRTLDHALAVRATGATRFGATATIAILEEARMRVANGEGLEEAKSSLGSGY